MANSDLRTAKPSVGLEGGSVSELTAANDNRRIFSPHLDRAVAGQAITISQPHRKFGRAYAEFIGHAGDGKHVLVRKLISGTWTARWTKPLKVERALVLSVHDRLARAA